MNDTLKGRAPRWVALLGIAVIAIGAYMIAPAIGGGGKTLTAKKAKKLYLQIKKANNTFLPKIGKTTLSLAHNSWVADTSLTSSVTYGTSTALFTAAGIATDQFFSLPLTVPSPLAGQAQRLASVELCYNANPNQVLDRIFVDQVTGTTASPTPTGVVVADDDTDRTDNTCATVTPPAPVPLGEDNGTMILVRVDFLEAGSMSVGHATANLIK